jgi:hypothetical protein
VAMYFSNEDIEYLSGKKFSTWFPLRLRDNPVMSRLECLITLTKNKRVLHIGCCDHISVIMEKVKNKTWLHGLFIENCSFVAGVDINAEAVQYVIDNIFITVPYAFGLRQMFSGIKKIEYNNSDHRYWFSPYTIAKVCIEAGIYPEELFFTGNPPYVLRLIREIKRKFHINDTSCFSTLANTLTVIGSFEKNIT